MVERGFNPASERVVFATTLWSVVADAGSVTGANASKAMAHLCHTYWYPIYAYVRRKGYDVPDAQDLTQEFFTRLLSRNYLNVADRNRGKFRSFLLGALEHFLAREWKKAHALKRGGGDSLFSLDELDAENRYLTEPRQDLTPEQILDRRWGMTVLDNAMARLEEECRSSGKVELFNQTKGLLSGERGEASYAEIAASLDTTVGAIKVAVHRLRQQYGDFIRQEVAQTVVRPEQVDEELRYLVTLLRA
jgi:RNA polymerase sigma-70 factor (ECF subfamily)